MKSSLAFCPECEYPLKPGASPQMGQRLVCPECRSSLMVVNLTPLELDLAPNSLTGPKKKGTRIEVPCPECDHLLKLGTNTPLGEELVCENCETELEVIGVNPFELDLALPVNFKRTRHKKQKPSRKFDQD